jgi:hypothetical protein
MMFVCRFQASRWSKPQREVKLDLDNVSGTLIFLYQSPILYDSSYILKVLTKNFYYINHVGWNLLKFWYYYSGYIQTHCQKNKKIKRADQILPELYGTTLIKPSLWKRFDLYLVNIVSKNKKT